ncbi:MAG: EamA family transporter RarD [Fidelibacterota bacterium]|nr:MAG: EamA family transporter RarD [Candidatus Neomarinimicrobiota bacterium]
MSSPGGIYYTVAAYAAWGLLPVYWKAMYQVPAHEILAHRMLWCLPFVLVLLAARGDLRDLFQAIRDRGVMLTLLFTASLLTLNWYLYIWAVSFDRIVDASLGYFINPLLTVLLGVFFLGERPRIWQWASIFLAFTGVLYLALVYGAFPWIGLGLALTFGFYALIRKTATPGSLKGLTIETTYLFLPALVYLLRLESSGSAAFGHGGLKISILLASTGVVTIIPLLIFAVGIRQTTLTTVGLLQYIAPTLQFLIGVLVYFEPVSPTRLTGFAIIWVALGVFSIEGMLHTRQKIQATNKTKQ